MMNDQTAKIIVEEDRYPDGANTPTWHVEYLCPCKKGKIVYESVRGFHDDYAFIECAECKGKYEIRTGYGYRWQLEIKR
ncbi:MAG: hypothetical protein J6D30_02910 [Clostridia bacterium]|nr:hypothetical protein [Clostridia bacterium]